MSEEEKSTLVALLKAGKERLSELLDFLEKNAAWLIPVIKKLIEMYQKIKPSYIG